MTIAEESVHLQLYARAPAPCRDYYGLTVSSSLVVLNIWNISHGPHVYPKRQKSSLSEFHEDKYLQSEIRRLFGDHVLRFVLQLAANERNLQFLPTKIFLRILRLLAANDILHLSQTSKLFFELCNTDRIWKIIFRKRMKRRILFQDCVTAETIGWREAAKDRICRKMFAGKNVLPKSAAPTGNNKNKTVNNAKAPTTASKSVKNPNAKKDVNIKTQAMNARNLNNSKARELNNKTQLIQVSAKKPELDMIRNVGKDTVRAKIVKSANQLKSVNEKSDSKKANVNKSVSPNSAQMDSQTKLKLPANRCQINSNRLNLRSPETGDGAMTHLNNSVKNNLNKKVGAKSATLSKEAAKANWKY